MQAMVLNKLAPIETHPLQLQDVPSPVIGPEQVLIEVEACGICHTDLHVVEGDLRLPCLPIIPGHQVVGQVVDIGEEIACEHLRDVPTQTADETRSDVGISPGDRVGVPWLHWTCGECDYCRKGSENLCDSARFTGYTVNGGFAQKIVAFAAFVCRAPDSVGATHVAPLLCGGIIGYRALRLSDVEHGGRLGLFGFGSSAHIAMQVAQHWGCEVYVFTRSQNHRKLAESMGAVWVGGAEDNPSRLLDSAIIFAPAGRLIPDALRVLRKGGTLALAGVTMTPAPQMPYELLYHERTIRSVANSTRQDAEELLALAAEIPIQTHVEVFDLSEANEALVALKESRLHASGVLQVK